MKRFALLFSIASLLALGLLSYCLLVLPRPYKRELIERSLADSETRFQQSQQRAKEPELNGYLNEKFLSFWGPDGHDEGPAGLVVTAWNTYSPAAVRKPVEFSSLASDSGYRKARADFEGLLPELLDAFNKEAFVMPLARRSLEVPIPRLLAVKASATALVGYSALLIEEGEAGRAAEILETVIHLGGNLLGQGFLIQEMFGVSLREVAFEAVVHLFEAKDLTGDQWERLAASVKAAAASEHQVQEVMTDEMVATLNTFDDIRQGKSAQHQMPLGGRWMMGREARIYQNDMARLLEAVEKGDFKKVDSTVGNFRWSGWLTGECGLLSAIATPSYSRFLARLRYARLQQAGLYTFCKLRAFWSFHGKLPDRLQELGPPYPGVAWDDPALRFQNGLLEVVVPAELAEPREDEAKGRVYPSTSQYQVSGAGLQFQP